MFRIGASAQDTSGGLQRVGAKARRADVADRVISSFSPSLWIDARDTAAGDLSTWPQHKGGAPLTQGVGAKQPERLTHGWAADNGPCVAFDGVGECMTGSTPNLSGVSKCSLFTTCKTDASGAHAMVAEYTANVFLLNAGVALQFSNTASQTQATGIHSDALTQRYGYSGTNQVGLEHCAGMTCDMALTGNDAGNTWIDGASVSVADLGGEPAGTFAAGANWNIGSQNDGAAKPLNGTIRELVVVDGQTLTAAQAATLSRALRVKAGLL